VEHEAVHAHLLIARNADLGDESVFVAYRSQCGHEPAVAVVALSHVVGSRAFDEELRSVEDVLFMAHPISVTRRRAQQTWRVTSILLTDMG